MGYFCVYQCRNDLDKDRPKWTCHQNDRKDWRILELNSSSEIVEAATMYWEYGSFQVDDKAKEGTEYHMYIYDLRLRGACNKQVRRQTITIFPSSQCLFKVRSLINNTSLGMKPICKVLPVICFSGVNIADRPLERRRIIKEKRI